MAYNPSQNIPLSKPMGPVNFPVDGRMLFYDSTNFTYRAYISTSEVISNIPIQFRNVGLSVLVNTGGTLSGGVITGGENEVYFFKNGISNSHLQPLAKVEYDVTEGKNRFNVNDFINNTSVNDQGQLITINGRKTSSIIRVYQAPYTLTLFQAPGKRYRWLDVNQQHISNGVFSSTPQTLTPPVNAEYFQFTYKIESESDSSVSQTQFEKGNSSTSFSPFVDDIKNLLSINGAIAITKDDIGNFATKDELPVLGTVLGKNLFNINDLIDNTTVTDLGQLASFSGRKTSALIPVVSGNTYTITLPGATSKRYRWLNSNSEPIGNVGPVFTGVNQTFTAPNGAVYFQFTVKVVGESDDTLNQIQFEKGSVSTPFEEYKIRVNAIDEIIINNADFEVYPKNEVYNKQETEDLIPVVESETILGSKNLANPSEFTDGGFMIGTGAITANATYGYTGFISVTPGLPYSGSDGVIANAVRHICYFDANKNVVPGGSLNTDPPFTTKTTPVNAAFARATYTVSNKSSFQFEQSSSPTSFAPYSPPTKILKSVDGAIVQQQNPKKRIGLKDCEVDVWFGDSYSMGEYKLKGKGYLNKVSMFTDRRLENYSKSGDTLAAILTRIKNNDKTYHPSIGINDYPKGGYGFIGSWTNEFGSGASMNNSSNMDAYLQNLKLVAEAVKSIGLSPVIFTEHTIEPVSQPTRFGLLAQSAIKDFCFTNNYIFLDVYEQARLIRGGADNPKFWFGSHPGVRTDSIYYQAFIRFYKTLPPSKQSIKIYRKRSQFSISNINDLIYGNKEERARRFKEIFIGQSAISDARQNYFDDLTTMNTGGLYSSQKICEYLKIQNRENVSFTDYALVECVVNGTSNNIDEFQLFISDSSVSVYVIDLINKSLTQIAGSLDSDSGDQVYKLTQFEKYFSIDKVSFIIYKSGGFNINNLYYEWIGSEGKNMNAYPSGSVIKSSELLSNTNFNDTGTGWTLTGVTPFQPSDLNVPFGSNRVVALTTTNTVSTTVNFSADNIYARKCQLSLTCLRYIQPFDSSLNYPSQSPITDDTFDFDNVEVEIKFNSNNVINSKKLTGLHWNEVKFEFVIPVGCNSLIITVKSGSVTSTIWLAKASFMIEQ